jgi:hypothetical protein
MISLFLFLFSILCFGEEIGQYYSTFNRVYGGLFLLLYLVHNKDFAGRINKNGKFRLKLAATLVLVLLSFGSPIAVISVGLVLIIPGIWHEKDEFSIGLVFFLYLIWPIWVIRFRFNLGSIGRK